MSLLPTLTDKSASSADPASIGAGHPLPMRKALMVWITLMLAAWLLLGAGAYGVIMPNS
jgi:hypothetical protein